MSNVADQIGVYTDTNTGADTDTGMVVIYIFIFILIIAIGVMVANTSAGTSGVTGNGSLIGLGVAIGLPLVAFGAYYGRKYWRSRERAADAKGMNQHAPALATNAPGYHIIKGFIPNINPQPANATFTWDHVDTLMNKSEDTFVWLSAGVWGAFVYPKDIINEDTKFTRAPGATTYIKKSDTNKFLETLG